MSAPSPAHVRPAVAGDLSAIGAIQANAWRAGYAGLVPPDVLDSIDPSALAEQWRASVVTPPSPTHVVLAAVGSDLVLGFAACDADGLIVALEVDPAHRRQGHGSRLLSAVADHARTYGLSHLSLWCPLADEARRAFLESAGFGPSGGVRDLAGATGETVREAHLVASLTPASGA